MLAHARGDSEPTPDNQVRREVLKVLAALGPPLLTASRSIDTADPEAALPALSEAARILAPYLT